MAFERKKKGFFGRLSEKIADVVMGRPAIDEDLLEDLEEVLITSDIGMETTMHIVERLRAEIKTEKLETPDQVTDCLLYTSPSPRD